MPLFQIVLFRPVSEAMPADRDGNGPGRDGDVDAGRDHSDNGDVGSASQIALFVAPVLVLLSYVIGPAPMELLFWPGAVVMILIATIIVALVTNSGQSAWYTGVLVLMVYLIFAMTLYLLPVR